MERITVKKILPEERETLLIYDQTNKTWSLETFISKHYNSCLRKNWTQTRVYVNEEGVEIGGCFEAPARAITIRSAEKRKMSQKQLDNLVDDEDDEDE